jgi:zinc protease
MNVALLPKKNRGETVSVALNLRWGNEQALFGKRAVARLTAGMLMRGNEKYTREELADVFDKLKMSGNVNRFDTTKANLSAALQLAAQVLQKPNFSAAAFQELVKESLVSIESSRNDPAALAAQALAQHFDHYPKGDWRAAETIDETIANIKAVSLEDVKAFHKEFYGASKGELSIIGDFDPADISKVIQAAFSDWKSATPYQRVSEQFFDIAPLRIEINTPDKENGSYLAAMNLRLRDDDPDIPALMIADYLFGGGAGLNSRLMERVRQKDGLSYGIRSNLQVSSLDYSGSFTISAIAAPQNLAKVAIAVKEEIDKVRNEGFTAQEVARAKSGYVQQRMQSRSQDPSLAVAWNTFLYLDRSFAWSKMREDKITALTVEQVNAAFRKAIDPTKLTVITAGDAAKAKLAQK